MQDFPQLFRGQDDDRRIRDERRRPGLLEHHRLGAEAVRDQSILLTAIDKDTVYYLRTTSTTSTTGPLYGE